MTLEFDFHAEEPMGSALMVSGLNSAGRTGWAVTFPEGQNMAVRSGELFASTPLEDGAVPGRHHVMFMTRGPALKAYIDRQRLVNLPDISADAGLPEAIDIRLWASTHPMITNLRFAEGPKPAKDLLASGRLVTHGIRFATGSDVVQPEVPRRGSRSPGIPTTWASPRPISTCPSTARRRWQRSWARSSPSPPIG